MATRGGRTVFASYNIHKCVGSDRRFDPERMAAVIGEIGADVIALQEADKRFGDRAGLLDLAAIERDAGPRAGPGQQRPQRPRLARQPRPRPRGRSSAACARSACPGSSRAAPSSSTSTSRWARCGSSRPTSGCCARSRLLQVEALLEQAARIDRTGRWC